MARQRRFPGAYDATSSANAAKLDAADALGTPADEAGMTGRPLRPGEVVPRPAIEFVAAQVGADPDAFDGYARERDTTRRLSRPCHAPGLRLADMEGHARWGDVGTERVTYARSKRGLASAIVAGTRATTTRMPEDRVACRRKDRKARPLP